jgi:hypothetical protein
MQVFSKFFTSSFNCFNENIAVQLPFNHKKTPGPSQRIVPGVFLFYQMRYFSTNSGGIPTQM